VGGVTPRPIAVVTTVSASGVPNVAPYSFFNAAGPSPMTLMFVPVTKGDGGPKDTLANVRPPEEGGTGEFVVNLAVEAYARQMAATSHALPPEESELERVGLATAPSRRVKAPRLAASPMAFECVTTQIVPIDPGRPGSGNVVFGRVVHVFVRDDVVNERFHVDPEKLRTLGRMGGRFYARTRERFELPADLSALEAPPPFPEDVGG
ncbi:MAG TPA: flavin reductase family protein, partial [Polyangiaceae bacterium LLY-WYZ-15_(1-7)]|nr:flavin reductase family protein [Polyangiaceae bacterium LLY-WYZ-15_(1-7)]